MNKHPLNETFDKVARDLQKSIEDATKDLQRSMQEYLSYIINISKLLKMVDKMGLRNVIGVTGTPIPGMDYYQILGLNNTASNKEVKKRYLEIMAKIHPDISGKEMTFLVALVNTAYDIICKERGIE